jgi:Fuc2NAc and GlcNAc transferase
MVQAFDSLTWGLAAVSLALSAAGVRLSIRIARRAGVMDIPNERSSHTLPTPRMGGVPMVVAAVSTFCWWALSASGGNFPAGGIYGVMIFALGMSVLGFWDDLSSLSPFFRFVVQLSGAALILWTATGFLPISLRKTWMFPWWAWYPACAVWVVWMLNLYNFMDGIDGLAGGEAAVAALFFFLVFLRCGEPGWATANLCVAAASAGFLIFNWPPASVFMGDAGSAFLGSFFGMQSILAPMTTPAPFLVLVLPFANFILDATVTLAGRMWRREKWYEPHRRHFYQRMTGLGMSHAGVTAKELAAVLLSCAAAAIYLEYNNFFVRLASVYVVMAGLAMAGIRIRGMERERQAPAS